MLGNGIQFPGLTLNTEHTPISVVYRCKEAIKDKVSEGYPFVEAFNFTW